MTNLDNVSVNIKWEDTGIIEEVAKKVAMKGLYKLGAQILGEAKKQCPVDSGTLMRSGAISKNGETITISFNTHYARIQHEGGTIRPVKGKYLKFTNKAGKDVFVKQVVITGKKYLERPFNELKGQARLRCEQAIADYYTKKNYGEYKS